MSISVFQVGVFQKDSPDGVNRVIYALGRLLEKDISYNVVTFDLRNTEDYKVENMNGVIIHHFRKVSCRGLFVPKSFYSWIKELPIDSLFHLHSVFYPLNMTIARACVRHRINYIFTPHDSYSVNSLKSKKFLKLIYLRTFERYVLNHARKIQALTASGVQDIAKFTSNNNIELIRNFVDAPAYVANRNFKKGEFTFVGRIDVFQKGIDLLLQAMSGAKNNCDLNFRLNIIGPGTRGEYNKLRRLISLSNLKEGKDVIVHGALNEKEKEIIVRSSQYYVQTSRFEGFGLSVVEALALGVPVIISKNIPIHEVVLQYRSGIVCNDIDDIFRAIISSTNISKIQYEEMCHNARRSYQESFSQRNIKDAFLRLYGNVT